MAKKQESVALMVIEGETVNNRTPFDGLTFDERDELFILFDRHHESISAIARDIECKFGRDRVRYYIKVYDFEVRLRRDKAIRIAIWKKNSGQMLIDGKRKVVEQALKMLETKQIEWMDKKGNKVTLMKEPTSKELDIVYKILKTELGESIHIASKEDVSGGREIEKETEDTGFSINIKTFKKIDDNKRLDTNRKTG